MSDEPADPPQPPVSENPPSEYPEPCPVLGPAVQVQEPNAITTADDLRVMMSRRMALLKG